MVVTVTPALAMKSTLNGSNQFIIKLINEHKPPISDAITRRNPPPAKHPDRLG